MVEEAFQGAAHSGSMKHVAHRSLFHLTAVRQLDIALRDLGDVPDRDFTEMCRKRVSGMITTQAVEDWNGFQNNSRRIKGSKKYRRPHKCLAIGNLKKVVSERHHFRALPSDLALGKQKPQLDPSLFEAPASAQSIDFGRIASTPQSTM